MNILEEIIQNKKALVAKLKKDKPVEFLKDLPNFHRNTFSLKSTLKQKSGIIAEFKRQSPSKGLINDDANVRNVAKNYEKFGARAISILTDEPFFGGTLDDILAVRNEAKIPILRKDFMIDSYQFYEAKAAGADVILLIAANLTPSQVQEFTDLAHQLNLEVLLEIHHEKELNHINQKIDFVGINNRNLKDFKVDLNRSVALKNQLPSDILKIAESGIYSVQDFHFLKEKGFDGFLMGEFFMKNANPGLAFQEFTKEI